MLSLAIFETEKLEQEKIMIKFIHAADIHLDSPLRGLEVHEDAPVEEIRGAARRAFDRLIDLALDEEVDFILIAGDLYDGDWKDYNTGLFFASRMGKLANAGIKVFIVSGNHDAASQITRAMPLPDKVMLFSKQKPESIALDDLGIMIHGQSYSSSAVTDNLAVQYPQYHAGYFNIGLLHTSLTGRPGHENYAPCTLDDLNSKGYDYWALGHVHHREILAQDPWIVFSGNIQGRHIRETGAKGASLVTVEDGRILGVEAHELDVLRWAVCQVEMGECDTIDGVYDAVRQGFELERDQADGRTIALRLVLTGQSPVHSRLVDQKARLTEEFRGIAAGLGSVWLEKVIFATSPKTSHGTTPGQSFGKDTPLAGLSRSIQNLELDGESLVDMVPELATLKSKLPPEIHGNNDPNDLDDIFFASSPEKIKALLTQVQELLMAKLHEHGGAR